MLHLVVPSFLASGGVIALTPQGRSIAASVWGRLKDLFLKKVSASPWRLWFVYRHASPNGDVTELGFGWQRDAAPPQINMPVCNGPLKELPPALGCERLTVPAIATSPESVIPRALPAQVFAPTVTEGPQQPVDRMTPSRKRRMRRRVTRRKQSLSVAKKRTSRRSSS
jgi:hypothetical protein